MIESGTRLKPTQRKYLAEISLALQVIATGKKSFGDSSHLDTLNSSIPALSLSFREYLTRVIQVDDLDFRFSESTKIGDVQHSSDIVHMAPSDLSLTVQLLVKHAEQLIPTDATSDDPMSNLIFSLKEGHGPCLMDKIAKLSRRTQLPIPLSIPDCFDNAMKADYMLWREAKARVLILLKARGLASAGSVALSQVLRNDSSEDKIAQAIRNIIGDGIFGTLQITEFREKTSSIMSTMAARGLIPSGEQGIEAVQKAVEKVIFHTDDGKGEPIAIVSVGSCTERRAVAEVKQRARGLDERYFGSREKERST